VAFAKNSSDHPFAGTIDCPVAGMDFSFSSYQTKASNEAETEGVSMLQNSNAGCRQARKTRNKEGGRDQSSM